ncbi:vacuolar protein sorting-associated protein 13B [Caerostris darwini]|uniref:Vacuolar protein sorting-associated protein 13B n=1 Tax=Caerostris darwini TaxID=1538125 RepID=A0AAV4WPL5_9ARAC|nr:vacuolar protein sorting-associated protein 13B [Caerostris darwini]
MEFHMKIVLLLIVEQSSVLFHAPEPTKSLHAGIDYKKIMAEDSLSDEELFLQCFLQIPTVQNGENPALLLLQISGSTGYLEPAFFNWLSSALFIHITLNVHELEYACSSPTDFEETSTCSSHTQEASTSYSITKSHSTVLTSTKKISLHENVENFLLEHCQFLSCLVLEVEIGSFCAVVPQSSWSVKYADGLPVLYSWQQAQLNGHLNGACVFCLPDISVKNNSSVGSYLMSDEFAELFVRYEINDCDNKSEDCFPWILQLNSCSVYTVEQNNKTKYNFLLCPTTFSATIALLLKSNPNQVALCIHMDSKYVHFNFSILQAELLVHCFNLVSAVVTFTERLKSWINYFQLIMPDVPDYRACYSELNPMDISFKQKKPSGYSQCKKTSDSEAKLQNLEENKPSQRLTLWAQLTLSKLCFIILGRLSSSCNYDDFKIQFDTEEIVSSIDIQEIYSKMKIKLSSLNINCFVKKSESHSWEPGPYEGKVIFCSNMISKNKSKMATNSSNLGHSLMKPDNQPFLVATYTKALHSNVKEKLSSAVKQIYLPENCTLNKDLLKENIKSENKEVEVLLLQLDYVTLTSQVENPLPRIILNSDIYANALNSKTITLPGAAVEDRQYQMDICGLMLGSISGPNIICQSDLKKDFVSHYPLTMGENPALEWNIGAIPENRNLAKDSVMIIPIVSPLNIRIVIAPAIVYQSINKDTESEKILVAGISSEVSITSEVCLYLSIHGTCFMYSLLKNNLDFLLGILNNSEYFGIHNKDSPAPTRTCRNYKSLDSTSSSPIISPDSSNFQMKSNSEDISDKYNFMPFELLITAGTISVMLFYYDDCHKSVDDNILSQKFEDFGVQNVQL